MARLDPHPYPGNWTADAEEDWRVWTKRQEEQLAAIPEDRLLRFPVADGYAFYFVKSERPLVLQHVPFCDRWQVPAAHIRGLRLADVRAHIEGRRRMRELFTRKP